MAEGLRFYDLALYDLAIFQFTNAVQVDSNHALAYSWRAFSYYELGLYEQAILDLDQAILLEPSPLHYYNLGAAYDKKGWYWQAILDYNNALLLDPTYAVAYVGRGNAYYRLDLTGRGREDWDTACRLDRLYC